MLSGALKRREFCLRGCRAASAMTIASTLGCGGESPTAPSQPPPTSTTPPPANPTPPEGPPPSNPPPANPTPPPPSPIVSQLPLVSATLVQGLVTVTIDGASPLSTLWGAGLTQIFVDGIQRSVLLARIGPDAFAALNAVCTHEGCVVSRYASPIFVCPCHGSRYDTTGAVVQGPAPAALPRFFTEYRDGVLQVRL